jgi:hypothetical protein
MHAAANTASTVRTGHGCVRPRHGAEAAQSGLSFRVLMRAIAVPPACSAEGFFARRRLFRFA